MDFPRQLIVIGAAFGIAVSSTAAAADPPPPPRKPTPKPGTLAALASTRMLNRTPGVDGATAIVITDENLATLGRGASLTVMTATIADPIESPAGVQVNAKIREKWRKKVLAQGGAIAKLEARRADAEAELSRLELGKLDSRTLDRIAKVERKLRAIDAEIRTEKKRLSTIIRDARREGAQPGWFR